MGGKQYRLFSPFGLFSTFFYSHRVFRASDGIEYKWIMGSYTPKVSDLLFRLDAHT